VRKAGEALRVTAQLIRADTDEHLWSERFGGALTDVFDVPEEERRLATRPMDDLRAYESYLEAREASLEWSREALEHALEHLERARARVGENAVVLAGMGYVYSQFSNMALYDRDYLALVEEHARRALALDPDNPEAHMVLGFPYQEGLQDVDLSVHHLERSLQVEPDDPHTLTWWIIALSAVGRNDEMRAAAERLVEAPFGPWRAVVVRRGSFVPGGEAPIDVYLESERGTANPQRAVAGLRCDGCSETQTVGASRPLAFSIPLPESVDPEALDLELRVGGGGRRYAGRLPLYAAAASEPVRLDPGPPSVPGAVWAFLGVFLVCQLGVVATWLYFASRVSRSDSSR